MLSCECPKTPQITINLSFVLSIPVPILPTIIRHHRHFRHRGRELTPRSDAIAIFVEDGGDRRKHEGDTGEESAGPVYVQSLEHVHAEEGKDGSG